MAVYIELTTDAFATTFTQQANAVTPSSRAGLSRARRPLRGLEIKDDTYAILKVVQSNGTEIPLIDSGAVNGTNTQYSNFILQSVSEARMEKHQIVETFGEPYIFFFGESPRFLDVQAILVDSLDFNWYAEFWANYEQYLRGSKSVEMGARTYLFYDDNIVEGYMLMASARKTSDQPLQAQLTFRLFLTNYQNITLVNGTSTSDNYPIRASVNLPPDVSLTTADAFTVGEAALNAADTAATQEALQLAAQSGAAAQGAGFGGGLSLSLALSSGVQPTGNLFVSGIESNVLEALGNAVGNPPRTLPFRSLISDNADEFTAALPPAPGQDNPSGSEAPDLWTSAIQQVALYGGSINDPTAFAGLGLGANFGVGVGVGIGIGVGVGVGASFGPTGGVGLGGVYGGINGGLGFSGGAGIGVGVSLGIGLQQSLVQQQLAQRGSLVSSEFVGTNASLFGLDGNSRFYGNGVQLFGGVYGGTGVGGGIPGGVSGGIGPFGPGTLSQFTGGSSFTGPQSSSMGYGAGITGVGASINIGGAPSAFAMVVTPGVLSTTPSTALEFNVGTDGNASDVNETGYGV